VSAETTAAPVAPEATGPRRIEHDGLLDVRDL
jgi:hypothetical protein